ncbi:MAG: 4'-phosphopantetheinyl transferase family protein [Bacteroidota bacterium]
MKGQELVDGKDRPLWWRMEHSGGLWALVLVEEAYAQDQGFDDVEASLEQGPRWSQWRSSRWALQLLWNAAADVLGANPSPMDLRKEPSGKPYLMNSGGVAVPVALAHTVGMGAAALADHPSLVGIGVDVERYSERFLRVASRISSMEDIAKVQGCVTGALEAEAAVLIWVIKEACYKAALTQVGLFGKNQLITRIEKNEDSIALDEPRWIGCVESNHAEASECPYERIEFEAGSFSQDHALWYWAVAWRKG